MTPPTVPDLPAEWPPTADQLAVLTTNLHWLLTDIAYELPRGQAGRERLDATATALERLAVLLRRHEPRGVTRGEVTAVGHQWDPGEYESRERERVERERREQERKDAEQQD